MSTQSEINRVFSSVARSYDIMNDIMSFGLHRLWKCSLCNEVVKPHSSLLDVAGGTGDIAIRTFARGKNINVTVCDINPDMLEIGREKSIDLGYVSINWICASGESLPFQDDTFDYYTIAFGIRNIPNRQAALREAFRVLKPCGRFMCLEFSPIIEKSYFKTAYDIYSLRVIPNIGKIVAGDMEAYLYLVNSIREFPTPQQFAHEVSDAKFSMVTYRNIFRGVATLYSAWKTQSM